MFFNESFAYPTKQYYIEPNERTKKRIEKQVIYIMGVYKKFFRGIPVFLGIHIVNYHCFLMKALLIQQSNTI